MKKVVWFGMLTLVAALMVCAAPVAAGEKTDIYAKFEKEEIKPYLKIMEGPWVSNIIEGNAGNYRITAKLPAGSKYLLGLFDNKVGRQGNDQRSVVVLVDGVNPLAPAESVPVGKITGADVTGMRKYAIDGMSFNARDNSGQDTCVKVVDSKEEYDFGPNKPFVIPAGKKGNNMSRIDIFIFAGPIISPIPGQEVQYGKPLTTFSITLAED